MLRLNSINAFTEEKSAEITCFRVFMAALRFRKASSSSKHNEEEGAPQKTPAHGGLPFPNKKNMKEKATDGIKWIFQIEKG